MEEYNGEIFQIEILSVRCLKIKKKIKGKKQNLEL